MLNRQETNGDAFQKQKTNKQAQKRSWSPSKKSKCRKADSGKTKRPKLSPGPKMPRGRWIERDFDWNRTKIETTWKKVRILRTLSLTINLTDKRLNLQLLRNFVQLKHQQTDEGERSKKTQTKKKEKGKSLVLKKAEWNKSSVGLHNRNLRVRKRKSENATNQAKREEQKMQSWHVAEGKPDEEMTKVRVVGRTLSFP